MKKPNIHVNSGDEIIIVIPEDVNEDEIEIDLDQLGIDVDSIDGDINITIQVEGENNDVEIIGEDEFIQEPNEWCYDEDPYNIVYYEFPDE